MNELARRRLSRHHHAADLKLDFVGHRNGGRWTRADPLCWCRCEAPDNEWLKGEQLLCGACGIELRHRHPRADVGRRHELARIRWEEDEAVAEPRRNGFER